MTSSLLYVRIRHYDREQRLVQSTGWLPNLLHQGGELWTLARLLDTDNAVLPGTYPTSFYLGLDNRASLVDTQTLADLTGEPTTGGYARQAVSTVTGFTLSLVSGAYQATTAALTFGPSGVNWSQVANVFLATTSDNTGTLISTVALPTPLTLTDGSTVDVDAQIRLQNPS